MHEIPTGIETLERHSAWANWTLIALTLITFVISGFGDLERGAVEPWILNGWNLRGMIGHLFLHADAGHLISNLFFLLLFGSVVCHTVGAWVYLPLYLACGLGAAVIHLVTGGGNAVGASGAISGLCGLTLALFPQNRVQFGAGSWVERVGFDLRVWFFCALSAFWDLLGAIRGTGSIGYWSHLGGLLTGTGLGLLSLHRGWIKLSCYDNKSLYELLTGRELERIDDRSGDDSPDSAGAEE